MSRTVNQTSKQFTGRHMAAIMVSFFAVIICVNFTMAFLAKKSWTGLVVPNSYVASQKFNKETEKLDAAAALNIGSAIEYSKGEITLALRDFAGTPVTVSKAILSLGKATNAVDRQSIDMTCNTPGKCVASVELEPGQWVGDVTATVAKGKEWIRPVKLWIGGISP